MSACQYCGGAGYIPYAGVPCSACSGTGMQQTGRLAGPAGAKPAGPKPGDVHVDACKRCKNAGSVRVLKVELDKLQLFCKLCGHERAAKR